MTPFGFIVIGYLALLAALGCILSGRPDAGDVFGIVAGVAAVSGVLEVLAS